MTSRRTYQRAISVSSGTARIERSPGRKLNRQKSLVLFKSSEPSTKPTPRVKPIIMTNGMESPSATSQRTLPPLNLGGPSAGGRVSSLKTPPVLVVKLPDIHKKAVKETALCLRFVGDTYYSGQKPCPEMFKAFHQRRTGVL